MTNTNVALRQAEISLGKAKDLFESVKRDYGFIRPTQRHSTPLEPVRLPDPDSTSSSGKWTAQEELMRALAGLNTVPPLVVGAINEQQALRRNLAGLPVRSGTTIVTSRSVFLPAFAEAVHAKLGEVRSGSSRRVAHTRPQDSV